ncbi:hypothetical protein BC830DRAFT_1156511 [Chytriomyces sp. MP71]|nr:hypothetical protein BC830DRAFT_1156511 [Chytriomyces sp. MP71]
MVPTFLTLTLLIRHAFSQDCGGVQTNPASGQQVYIKDANNFCIMLPAPSLGKVGIAAAEGLQLQSFCVGSHLPPGSVQFPDGAIASAHVIRDYGNPNDSFFQITGTLSCDTANLDCNAEGGQYDNMPCGSAPSSGVDKDAVPGPSPSTPLQSYVSILGGSNQFCMRVCSGGLNIGDACNAHFDTGGCSGIMTHEDYSAGFSYMEIGGLTVNQNNLQNATKAPTSVISASPAGQATVSDSASTPAVAMSNASSGTSFNSTQGQLSSSDSSSNSISGGAIAGIVVGCLAAIGLIAVAFSVLGKRYMAVPKREIGETAFVMSA